MFSPHNRTDCPVYPDIITLHMENKKKFTQNPKLKPMDQVSDRNGGVKSLLDSCSPWKRMKNGEKWG